MLGGREPRLGGCGALVDQRSWGKIKRMYVARGARGQGLGRLLLAALEAHAREARIKVLRLETGTKQPAALSLYRAAGYRPRERVGAYAADVTSILLDTRL